MSAAGDENTEWGNIKVMVKGVEKQTKWNLRGGEWKDEIKAYEIMRNRHKHHLSCAEISERWRVGAAFARSELCSAWPQKWASLEKVLSTLEARLSSTWTHKRRVCGVRRTCGGRPPQQIHKSLEINPQIRNVAQTNQKVCWRLG